jgi:ribosomal protein S12 methylthiotransferase accessory factor
MSSLDTLERHFQQIRMSPPDWPRHVIAAFAGVEALETWPRFPQGATLAQQRLGHGAGEDVATARTRAVGELVEIASCCVWGDEDIRTAAQADLPGPSFAPAELSGFSAAQTADRDDWNRRLTGLDWVPDIADPARPLDWMQAKCLFSGEAIFVPADCVLIGRRAPGDAAACAIADTNGCAAGVTTEDACLRALFELIERDAVGLWWYGQRHAPVIGQASHEVCRSVHAHLGRRGRRLLLLDVTSDIGVPTVAALAMDAAGGHIGAGFATRANLNAAVGAAVSELMLMELRVGAAQSPRSADASLKSWFQEVRFDRLVPFVDQPRSEPVLHSDADVDLDACMKRLKTAGCRVAIMDFTRSEFAVPVVRAVAPDLCHWKPRLGRARLTQGDGKTVCREGDLNPLLLRI